MAAQRALGKRTKIVTARTKYKTTDMAAKATNPAATRSWRVDRSSCRHLRPYIHLVVTAAAAAETHHAPKVALLKGGCVHTNCFVCASTNGPAKASGTTIQKAKAHAQSLGHVGRLLGKEDHNNRIRRKLLLSAAALESKWVMRVISCFSGVLLWLLLAMTGVSKNVADETCMVVPVGVGGGDDDVVVVEDGTFPPSP